MVNLKWWFIFCSSIVGLIICTMLGYTQQLWDVDISRLSYLIIVIYFGFSTFIGYMTYKAGTGNIKYAKLHRDSGWFVAELLMGLGMMGTIIGFLYMLGSTFSTSNLQVTQAILAGAATGLATACVTTLVGLICSFLLKMQLVNLDYLIPDDEE